MVIEAVMGYRGKEGEKLGGGGNCPPRPYLATPLCRIERD